MVHLVKTVKLKKLLQLSRRRSFPFTNECLLSV